ncbi:MAG TPA: CARDB domain-containing protein [Dissulfurispiraceae bacterium]|nr:CARDB domain-containing protein [Dissulfurispiraceae bacterium]
MNRIWGKFAGGLCCLLFLASAGYAQVSAIMIADPPLYTGVCPADIKFKGLITAQQPGRVQYRLVRSDGVLQPVETLEFATPGSREVTSEWTYVSRKAGRQDGWMSIMIVYPEERESSRAGFSVICDQTKPDLMARIKQSPKIVRAGFELGSQLRAIAVNRGEIPVKDVNVEVLLRKESSCDHMQAASGAAHFLNGALRGSREQVSLDGGQKTELKLNGPISIPTETQPGEYFLCIVIDPENRIIESNKANNCACSPVKITAAAGKPDLIVEKIAFKGWGKCEPNWPIFSFEVTVQNIGTAASPAMPDKAVLQVLDLHGNSWGNAVGLNAIAPGGSQTVVIPVYYFSEDPAHMTKVIPHPFRAVVDPHHLIDESNENNNKSDIIYLDPGLICPKPGS